MIKSGKPLPMGIDYANIVAHVTFQGNPLGVNSEHVYYLERETDCPLGNSTRFECSENTCEYHMSCITALCSAKGVMMPHPEDIFEATMAHADLDSIPIRCFKTHTKSLLVIIYLTVTKYT